MSEVKQDPSAPAMEALPVDGLSHQPTLKELLGELSLVEWVKTVRSGLRQAKDSGEYKYAHQEIRRLWSPVCGFVLPTVLLGFLMLTPEKSATEQNAVPVTLEAEKAIDDLKDDKPLEPPPDQPPPDIDNMDPVVSDVAMPGVPGPVGPTTGTSDPFSPKPASFDSVAIIKSPITMKGVYASRAPGARGSLTGGGGSGGPGGPGGTLIEAAIQRTLRYLKKNQQADGSWSSHKAAMTGMVILTYLAHGETPGDSKEFGPTVQKGIEYLLKSQAANGYFPGNYEHPIATYALCEAYGMTLHPGIKVAAEKAVALILAGQHPSGGFDYGMKQDDRDDTSVMGWAAQALKAAKMADAYSDKEALEKALKLAVRGFQKNAAPAGGFGYTGPGAGGLSAVGALCMQLLGAHNAGEVTRTLALMDGWVLDWEKPTVPGSSPQYYFYYATQAKFHAGGSTWKAWNEVMWKCYVKAQKITPKDQSGYVDLEGKPQEIGWWENTDHASDRPIMDTCLAALQLMVYYRYLPTYQTAKAVTDETAAAGVETSGDIKIDTGNL